MTIPKYNCIVVLGPTASGKTRLSCEIAAALNGEIISADSRQVYRGLDLTTGKDLSTYSVNGEPIVYHLVDIADPSQQYFLHQFQNDLRDAFDLIRSREKLPVVCGGTGLYLEALQKDFSLTQVPENVQLRADLEKESTQILINRLKRYNSMHTSTVDLSSRKRVIRGIEIAKYLANNTIQPPSVLPYQPFYIGIKIGLQELEQNIQLRLDERLAADMVGEVEEIINSGVSHERLHQLGLEFRHISRFLKGDVNYEEMRIGLAKDILKFARRQLTWFRRMEKQGIKIHWIPAGETQILEELRHYFTVSG